MYLPCTCTTYPICLLPHTLAVSTCQGLLSAVDACFKSLPVSEHKSLAMKWVGSGDEFITFDLISDPVLLTKYNAMVHKAHQLKRAQVNLQLLHMYMYMYVYSKCSMFPYVHVIKCLSLSYSVILRVSGSCVPHWVSFPDRLESHLVPIPSQTRSSWTGFCGWS